MAIGVRSVPIEPENSLALADLDRTTRDVLAWLQSPLQDGWRSMQSWISGADSPAVVHEAVSLLRHADLAVRQYEPETDGYRVHLVRHDWSQLRDALGLAATSWAMGKRREQCTVCEGFGTTSRSHHRTRKSGGYTYKPCAYCDGLGLKVDR